VPDPLTPDSTVGEWLDHPVGGPLLRQMVRQHGQDPAMLRTLRNFSMAKLSDMSGGAMPLDQVEALAAQVNATPVSEALVEEAEAGPRFDTPPRAVWKERITSGRFTGQTVIVTGAGSGIGRATASRVAREGGRVIAADVSTDRLKELTAALDAYDVVPVHADITSPDGVSAIVAAADGRVDALANVAGIGDDFSPLHEVSDEVWERVLGVNLNGMFRLTRAVLPLMLQAGRGAVVNVASEASLRGSAAGAAYTTSKHAVLGLTRSAAFMYATRNIRVNAVAPGGVATNIEVGPRPPLARERMDPLLTTIPAVALAEEIAASITFLLSDDSVNITGVLLPSDGGWSVQ
jgi:NAD(P)-dependent dehydrogenase (short-subunit alcohol dehydrogenase family)